jgi:hypothetical protein
VGIYGVERGNGQLLNVAADHPWRRIVLLGYASLDEPQISDALLRLRQVFPILELSRAAHHLVEHQPEVAAAQRHALQTALYVARLGHRAAQARDAGHDIHLGKAGQRPALPHGTAVIELEGHGPAPARVRMAATGMGGPPGARAKMNRVSVGATLAASSLATVTVPLMPALLAGAWSATRAMTGAVSGWPAGRAAGAVEPRPGARQQHAHALKVLGVGRHQLLQPAPVLEGAVPVAGLQGRSPGQRQGIQVVGLDAQGTRQQILGLAAQIALLGHGHGIGVFNQQVGVVRPQLAGLGVGPHGLGGTPCGQLGTRQQHPAIGIATSAFQALGQRLYRCVHLPFMDWRTLPRQHECAGLAHH